MQAVNFLLVQESGVGSEGSSLEAWMKSHKSEVAMTKTFTYTDQETV